MGPQLTILNMRCPYFTGSYYNYTHLYCNGTTTDCPYYRGVLNLCPQ